MFAAGCGFALGACPGIQLGGRHCEVGVTSWGTHLGLSFSFPCCVILIAFCFRDMGAMLVTRRSCDELGVGSLWRGGRGRGGGHRGGAAVVSSRSGVVWRGVAWWGSKSRWWGGDIISSSTWHVRGHH